MLIGENPNSDVSYIDEAIKLILPDGPTAFAFEAKATELSSRQVRIKIYLEVFNTSDENRSALSNYSKSDLESLFAMDRPVHVHFQDTDEDSFSMFECKIVDRSIANEIFAEILLEPLSKNRNRFIEEIYLTKSQRRSAHTPSIFCV